MTDNTNGGFPPEVPTKVHGRNAAEITAEVIKKNGLDVAQEIRELAKRAREEGELMAAFAEQVASDIIESSSYAAGRISGYLDRCAAARASVEEHKNDLADLPDTQPTEIPKQTNKAKQSFAAVEQALGKLGPAKPPSGSKFLLQDK